jgi:hypothetical protein
MIATGTFSYLLLFWLNQANTLTCNASLELKKKNLMKINASDIEIWTARSGVSLIVG